MLIIKSLFEQVSALEHRTLLAFSSIDSIDAKNPVDRRPLIYNVGRCVASRMKISRVVSGSGDDNGNTLVSCVFVVAVKLRLLGGWEFE